MTGLRSVNMQRTLRWNIVGQVTLLRLESSK